MDCSLHILRFSVKANIPDMVMDPSYLIVFADNAVFPRCAEVLYSCNLRPAILYPFEVLWKYYIGPYRLSFHKIFLRVASYLLDRPMKEDRCAVHIGLVCNAMEILDKCAVLVLALFKRFLCILLLGCIYRYPHHMADLAFSVLHRIYCCPKQSLLFPYKSVGFRGEWFS